MELVLFDSIGIFKMPIKATTKGNTIVVEAVIEPVIESKNTGRHAIKKRQFLDCFLCKM